MSKETKKQIIDRINKGYSFKEVAKYFNIKIVNAINVYKESLI